MIIDPGQEACDPLMKQVAQAHLNPVAVFLTHGHLDHTWSAASICAHYDIPAYIHPADRRMLADPMSGIGPILGQFIADMTFTEPAEVIDFRDGQEVEISGMNFRIAHTPGHTQGSVVLHSEGGGDYGPLAVTGDTLFQGSIGRSDLPGGNHHQLMGSITTTLLNLDDATLIMPGHGPTSTIGQERASNPFLRQL